MAASRLARESDADALIALLATLQRAGLPEEMPDFKAPLRHKDGRVRVAVADLLLAHDTPADLRSSLGRKLMARRDSALSRAAGVMLLLSSGDVLMEHDPLKMVGKEPEPRIALAELLRRDTEVFPWREGGRDLLTGLLEDPSWRVRAAAIKTALRLRKPDIVPTLIERLAVEEGRLRLDLAHALERLSGKRLGTDVELWRKWWKAVGADFEPVEKPMASGGQPGEGESRTTTASFFRVPVLGRRVAFLIDCSGSMRGPAVEGDESGPSKFDVARVELERTLGTLDRSVAFDVFLYRYPSVYPPEGYMTRALRKFSPCTATAAKRAVQWLAREPAKGWGAFYDGLAELLETDVDTIFFLSDGRPSRGTYDRDFRLVAELEKRNRFRQVVVHTVLTGRAAADRDFMRKLAESTGGRFTDVLGGGSSR
jgi:hypothetical protein